MALSWERKKIEPVRLSLKSAYVSRASLYIYLCPPRPSISKGQRYINPGLPNLCQLRPQSLTA